MDRSALLKKIVLFDNPDEAFSRLCHFDRLTPETGLVVDKNMLRNVLALYLSQKVTAEELNDWAIFLECSDEINCTPIEDYVFALANSDMIGGINNTSIAAMHNLL